MTASAARSEAPGACTMMLRRADDPRRRQQLQEDHGRAADAAAEAAKNGGEGRNAEAALEETKTLLDNEKRGAPQTPTLTVKAAADPAAALELRKNATGPLNAADAIAKDLAKLGIAKKNGDEDLDDGDDEEEEEKGTDCAKKLRDPVKSGPKPSSMKTATPSRATESKVGGRAEEARDVDYVARALWALASARGAERGEAVMARLDCSKVPGMDLGKYLKRVLRSLNKNDVEEVSRDDLLQTRFTVGFRLLGSALVLLDRLIARTSHRTAPLIVSQLNVHRLMLCTMMLVSKFSEDEPLNNAFWASIGGMPLSELNDCELILFKLLDFDARVAEEDFVLLVERLGITV